MNYVYEFSRWNKQNEKNSKINKKITEFENEMNKTVNFLFIFSKINPKKTKNEMKWK